MAGGLADCTRLRAASGSVAIPNMVFDIPEECRARLAVAVGALRGGCVELDPLGVVLLDDIHGEELAGASDRDGLSATARWEEGFVCKRGREQRLQAVSAVFVTAREAGHEVVGQMVFLTGDARATLGLGSLRLGRLEAVGVAAGLISTLCPGR